MTLGMVAAVSGIQAFQRKLDAHANNIANARTPEYEAERVTMREREHGGVEAVVTRDTSEGPPLPEDVAYSSEEIREGEEPREGSNVDVVEEMVGLRESARAIEMMAAAYRRQDETLGTLLDTFA